MERLEFWLANREFNELVVCCCRLMVRWWLLLNWTLRIWVACELSWTLLFDPILTLRLFKLVGLFFLLGDIFGFLCLVNTCCLIVTMRCAYKKVYCIKWLARLTIAFFIFINFFCWIKQKWIISSSVSLYFKQYSS